MNKIINLSDKSAVALRKIVGFFSIALSAINLVIVLLGVIPIYQQRSNPITIACNLLEVLNITSKSFFHCYLKFGFSIFYIITLIFIVKDFIGMVKFPKLWIKDEHDTGLARISLEISVTAQNNIFIRIIVLMVVSYMLDSFRLSFWAKFILVVLALGNFALNAMKTFLNKQNYLESIFSPVATTVILLCLTLFMFNVCNMDITIYIKSFANCIRTIINVSDSFSTRHILQMIISQILVPSLNIYILVTLVMVFIVSASYGVKFWKFERICKRFMIINIIALGVVVVLDIIAKGQFGLAALFNSIFNNWEFVLFSIAVFFLSKNHGSTFPNAPTYDDLLKTAEDNKNPVNVNDGDCGLNEQA